MFVPYLVPFHTDLLKDIRQYGDHANQDKFSFQIDQLYQYLSNLKILQNFLNLLHCNITYLHQQQTPIHHLPLHRNQRGFDVPAIANPEYDPDICTFNSQCCRCQVCLTGFHDEDDCYLQGPNFQDPALTCRIEIYNENRSNRPPKGHTIKALKHHSIPPLPFEILKSKHNNQCPQQVQFKDPSLQTKYCNLSPMVPKQC